MSQLPILAGNKIIKVLEKIGYKKIPQRASHIRLFCPGRRSVTVPDYPSISRGLLRKILHDAELSLDEFIKLL